MDTQVEKVYVALGNDLQDGFKTLDWTLRKWKSNPISIVILHVTYNFNKDFVYTPCKLHIRLYMLIWSIYFWLEVKWVLLLSSSFSSWEAPCKLCE